MSSQCVGIQRWEVTDHKCPTRDGCSVASLLNDITSSANPTVLQHEGGHEGFIVLHILVVFVQSRWFNFLEHFGG